MTREKEIDNAKTAFYKRVLEDDYYYDPRDCFEEGAKWADKTIIDKACEYAKARYDLDYCGNVKDVLNYLKSLVEE